MRCSRLWFLSQCYLVLKNMILGFDFLGFQAIKHFPTKNRIFLHVMQCTITNNSFLLVCTRVLPVCYWYASRMYSYIARVYSYVLVYTRMYSYVARMFSYVFVCCSYVLVWCFSHDLRNFYIGHPTDRD